MTGRGYQTFSGKEPLRRQIVFELRYRHGFAYHDRCGTILNRVTRDLPDWLLIGDVNPLNAQLYNVRNRCRFNFSNSRLDLNLERSPGDQPIDDAAFSDFADQVDVMCRIIFDELALKEFTRIGFRTLYHFPCETKQESEDWLRLLDFFRVSDKLTGAFGAKLETAGLSAVLVAQDCRYRIAFNVVERAAEINIGSEILSVRPHQLPKGQREALLQQLKAQRIRDRNPEYAVVIDIDAYHEDPPSVDPADFVTTHGRRLDTLRRALGEPTP